jgi:hypothetical protein
MNKFKVEDKVKLISISKMYLSYKYRKIINDLPYTDYSSFEQDIQKKYESILNCSITITKVMSFIDANFYYKIKNTDTFIHESYLELVKQNNPKW